jgi:sulfur-oxidizing protein SoxX
MLKHQWILLIVISFLLPGCDSGPDSPRGFSLPKGDVARGEKVFMFTGCLSCHVIDGIESDIYFELENPVKLGGKVTSIKTYGELVTSVINPSHKMAKRNMPEGEGPSGQSIMRNYNDTLTVSQLIDLVTFLESRYQLVTYEPTHYGLYYP